MRIGRLAQTPLIPPTDIPDAARRRGSPGFTLMEMVIVLAIVGILASIVAPLVIMALVTQGYLRAIPRDPVNGNKAEWKAVLAKEGGISDVHSLSNERGANGTPYADW
jgi:general secretion pathway protein G